MSRSDWVSPHVFDHILFALTLPNRLAIITSLTTGLRIGDVLALKSDAIKERFTITEKKTMKHRKVRLSPELLDDLIKISGKIWVFEHRTDPRKHRTRQAVYKDIKRACKLFRVSLNVSPHSARKLYAVTQYKRTCDISRVQALLNHSSEAVTMIYALADELTEREATEKQKQFLKPEQ